MPKAPVEYFDTDFLDNKIDIGDRVILEEPKYRNFVIGTVITKASKSCQIEYYDFVGAKQVARQYYGQIIRYPIREGKWLVHNYPDGSLKYYECSVCQKTQGHLSNYCEECGTKMNKEI